MAYKDFDGLSQGHQQPDNAKTIHAEAGHDVQVPDATFIRDAHFTHDGQDLVLDGPNGHLVIKDYFAEDTQPNLVAPDGSTLTPELVNSFAHSPAQFAQNSTLDDASPVGNVSEVSGHATVTHPDGTHETIAKGTPIFQGDVVETDAHGAVNINFIDETSFAVSQDARLAIDEYVYDPSTQHGSNNFSVLKGVFVFTSGLIGRDDPDDVHIHTPAGSIGIRGTIIAGNVTTGEVTVVEGAIVLTDNSGHEMTLATQFETARFHGNDGIEHVGQLSAHDVGEKFYVVSGVSPTLFSSINDAAAEQGTTDDGSTSSDGQQPVDQTTDPQHQPDAKDAAPTTGEPHTDSGMIQTATANVPAMPPVPPPVSMMTSGFETPGGFNTGLTNTVTTTTADTHNNTMAYAPPVTQFVAADTAAASTAAALPPSPPPVDNSQTTANTGNGTVAGSGTITPPINHAPVFHPEAPIDGSFFKIGEVNTSGNQWDYFFNKEFGDTDSGDVLTYTITDASGTNLGATALNNLTSNFLTGSAWSFSASDGHLILNLNPVFNTTNNSVTNNPIYITATDQDGAHFTQHFDLNFYNTQSAGLVTGTNSGYTSQNLFTTSIGGVELNNSTNNSVFGGAANDRFNLIGNSSNNYVNLGDGHNLVNVGSTAYGNTIVGGDDRDDITLNNAKVKVYGMDNDDDIRLSLSAPSTVQSDLNNAGSNTVIDGGHSNSFAANFLNQNLGLHISGVGTGIGRGDSLILDGTGSLDFTAINANNKITSIERLDMSSSANTQNVTLDLAHILSMTDDKHLLTINLGIGDELHLVGMANMQRVTGGDNITINDGAAGDSTFNRSYDVFHDNTSGVTLLISADAGTSPGAVTMDGNTVAIN